MLAWRRSAPPPRLGREGGRWGPGAYLQQDVCQPRVPVADEHPEADGEQCAAQGEADGTQGQEAHERRVDPGAAVEPEAQRHQEQGEQGGRRGHDDAAGWGGVGGGKRKPSKSSQGLSPQGYGGDWASPAIRAQKPGTFGQTTGRLRTLWERDSG